jgi:hypothetical protein
MKQLIKPGVFKYSYLLFLLTLTNIITRAQDSTITATTITTTASTEQQIWYTEPWV